MERGQNSKRDMRAKSPGRKLYPAETESPYKPKRTTYHKSPALDSSPPLFKQDRLGVCSPLDLAKMIVGTNSPPASPVVGHGQVWLPKQQKKVAEEPMALPRGVLVMESRLGGSCAGFQNGSSPLFHSPMQMISLPEDGGIVLLDVGNHCLRWVKADFTEVVTLGTPKLRLLRPSGIAYVPSSHDSLSGQIIISDTGHHRVRCLFVELDGAGGPPIKVEERDSLAGCGGRGFRDGAVKLSRFDCPHCIAVMLSPAPSLPKPLGGEPAAIVFVADFNNHCIRAVLPSTARVVTIAGEAQKAGHVDGVGNAARFMFPDNLCLMGEYLLIGDSRNCAIRRLCLRTLEVRTVAQQSRSTLSDDGGIASERRKRRRWPCGMCCASPIGLPGKVLATDKDRGCIHAVDVEDGSMSLVLSVRNAEIPFECPVGALCIERTSIDSLRRETKLLITDTALHALYSTALVEFSGKEEREEDVIDAALAIMMEVICDETFEEMETFLVDMVIEERAATDSAFHSSSKSVSWKEPLSEERTLSPKSPEVTVVVRSSSAQNDMSTSPATADANGNTNGISPAWKRLWRQETSKDTTHQATGSIHPGNGALQVERQLTSSSALAVKLFKRSKLSGDWEFVYSAFVSVLLPTQEETGGCIQITNAITGQDVSRILVDDHMSMTVDRGKPWLVVRRAKLVIGMEFDGLVDRSKFLRAFEHEGEEGEEELVTTQIVSEARSSLQHRTTTSTSVDDKLHETNGIRRENARSGSKRESFSAYKAILEHFHGANPTKKVLASPKSRSRYVTPPKKKTAINNRASTSGEKVKDDLKQSEGTSGSRRLSGSNSKEASRVKEDDSRSGLDSVIEKAMRLNQTFTRRSSYPSSAGTRLLERSQTSSKASSSPISTAEPQGLWSSPKRGRCSVPSPSKGHVERPRRAGAAEWYDMTAPTETPSKLFGDSARDIKESWNATELENSWTEDVRSPSSAKQSGSPGRNTMQSDTPQRSDETRREQDKLSGREAAVRRALHGTKDALASREAARLFDSDDDEEEGEDGQPVSMESRSETDDEGFKFRIHEQTAGAKREAFRSVQSPLSTDSDGGSDTDWRSASAKEREIQKKKASRFEMRMQQVNALHSESDLDSSFRHDTTTNSQSPRSDYSPAGVDRRGKEEEKEHEREGTVAYASETRGAGSTEDDDDELVLEDLTEERTVRAATNASSSMPEEGEETKEVSYRSTEVTSQLSSRDDNPTLQLVLKQLETLTQQMTALQEENRELRHKLTKEHDRQQNKQLMEALMKRS